MRLLVLLHDFEDLDLPHEIGLGLCRGLGVALHLGGRVVRLEAVLSTRKRIASPTLVAPVWSDTSSTTLAARHICAWSWESLWIGSPKRWSPRNVVVVGASSRNWRMQL